MATGSRGRASSGRPQLSSQTGDTFALAEWFNKNVDQMTELTNEQIADELGYTRPNIISMWRTGRTRIPLEKLPALAKILNFELVALLPLWIEQYTGGGGQVEIMRAIGRLASEDEAALLEQLRKTTKGRRFNLKPGFARKVAELIEIES